jgi:hypothetical protein
MSALCSTLAVVKTEIQAGPGMWIEKLAEGVVRIITPVGPRYIRLNFSQRVFFLWIFRHFDKLPQQVLSERQQRFIDQLCVEHHFISLPSSIDEAPIIGTLERVPVMQVEEVTSKRPVASVKDAPPPLVADLQQGP